MGYYRLPNGFELVYKKQKNSKVIAFYLGIKSGSGNEDNEIAGVSHFIEHLLFKNKSTTTTIESCGGYLNAYTSIDETVYYAILPSENYEKALYELKELVYNPKFSKEEIEFEKRIIIEELKGGKDNPYKILYEKLFSLTFKNHPYSKPVIGFKETIERLTYEKIIEYYKINYSPQNSFLVVTGDFDEFKLVNLVKEVFSDLKNGNLSKFEPEDDFSPLKFFHSRESLKFDQNYLGICFKIPKFLTQVSINLDVFANFFGAGQNSIILKKLKREKEIINEASCDVYPLKHSNLFLITVTFPKDIDENYVTSEIFSLIEMYYYKELKISEIEKSIINLTSEVYFEKENVSDEAKKLLFYHVVTGSWENEKNYFKKLKKVFPKGIKNSVKEFLKKENSNIVSLCTNQSKINLNKDKKLYLIRRIKKLEFFNLNNGIKVIFRKNSKTPLIAFKVGGLGGVKFENKSNNGISYFTAKYLTKGTKNFCENEIYDYIEGRGGELVTFSGRNSIGISGYSLKKEFFNTFEILKDILFFSEFPEKKLSSVKKDILNKIKAEKDNPYEVCMNTFYSLIFEGHPYSFKIKGEEKNINRFSVSDVQDFYTKIFIPENITLSFAGDIENNFIDYVLKSLNELNSNLKLKSKDFQVKLLNSDKIVEKKWGKNQCHIISGFLAPSMKDENSILMSFMKTCLGRMSGRLFNEIREKLGICYSIFPFYLKGVDTGCFGIYIVTDRNNKEKAIEEINSLYGNLTRKGLTSEEVESTKKFILGNYYISNQRFINLASSVFFNVIYGLGLDYEKKYLQKIKNLTKKRLDCFLENYFSNPKLTLIYK